MANWIAWLGAKMRGDAPETVYVNHEDLFSVVRQRGTPDRYFLDVLCGGIGMFERRIEMTPEEIETFLTDPKELRVLALKVAKWPERFKSRIMPLRNGKGVQSR